MTGFEFMSKETPCVLLWFPAWNLNSRLKFGFACFGVFLLGLVIEVLIMVRRTLSQHEGRRTVARRALLIWLFAANITLGYFAMLVAMTYSAELFMCVLAGMVLGHAVLNSDGPVGETAEPCCVGQNNAKPAEVIKPAMALTHVNTAFVQEDLVLAEETNKKKCCKKN